MIDKNEFLHDMYNDEIEENELVGKLENDLLKDEISNYRIIENFLNNQKRRFIDDNFTESIMNKIENSNIEKINFYKRLIFFSIVVIILLFSIIILPILNYFNSQIFLKNLSIFVYLTLSIIITMSVIVWVVLNPIFIQKFNQKVSEKMEKIFRITMNK